MADKRTTNCIGFLWQRWSSVVVCLSVLLDSLLVQSASGFTYLKTGTDTKLDIDITPTSSPALGSIVQLQCEIPWPSPHLSADCSLHWARSYLPARDGPREERLQSTAKTHDATSGIIIYDVLGPGGKPFRSILRILSMEETLRGKYRCVLSCPGESVMAQAYATLDVDGAGGSGMWLKKDLAMTMVSLVVIIFVFCMLLAGLVLRIRQCWSQRNFRMQQEHLCEVEDVDRSNGTSLDTEFPPPPRYSEVVDSNENLRDPKYQDNNNSAMVALCQEATSVNRGALCNTDSLYRSVNGGQGGTELSRDSGINDMSNNREDEDEEEESLCNVTDSLYVLQDHGESGSFDSVFLAISLPDYDEAVQDLERKGLHVNQGMLKPVPPVYTQFTF